MLYCRTARGIMPACMAATKRCCRRATINALPSCSPANESVPLAAVPLLALGVQERKVGVAAHVDGEAEDVHQVVGEALYGGGSRQGGLGGFVAQGRGKGEAEDAHQVVGEALSEGGIKEGLWYTGKGRSRQREEGFGC